MPQRSDEFPSPVPLALDPRPKATYSPPWFPLTNWGNIHPEQRSLQAVGLICGRSSTRTGLAFLARIASNRSCQQTARTDQKSAANRTRPISRNRKRQGSRQTQASLGPQREHRPGFPRSIWISACAGFILGSCTSPFAVAILVIHCLECTDALRHDLPIRVRDEAGDRDGPDTSTISRPPRSISRGVRAD